MTFFYDLNKKLDEIRATPSKTHGQLNERDMGKHNNATTGFKAVADKAAKEYGSKAAGERVAGAVKAKMAKAGKLEEQDMEEGIVGDTVKKVGGLAKKVGSAVLNKLGHGSDEDMIKDLQKKAGVPQTGKKPQQVDELSPDTLKSYSAKAKAQGTDDANWAKYHGGGDRYDGSNQTNPNTNYGPKGNPLAKSSQKRFAGAAKADARLGGMEEGVDKEAFAALAPPKDKITFADKIAGAKKEVDEMLGDVAAEAMKAALSPKQKKIDMNKNGKLDANDFAMLRKGGKKETDEGFPTVAGARAELNKRKVGDVTHGAKHDTEETPTGRRVTRRTDPNTGYSVGAEDDDDNKASGEKRGRGRPKGSKKAMGAKGPSGKSKLMTKEAEGEGSDLVKLAKVIQSCTSKEQLEAARKMAQNFLRKHASRDEMGFAGVGKDFRRRDDVVSDIARKQKELQGGQELDEKAVSKKQQKFMGMVHAAQKGEKPASKEVAKVAKTMKKSDAEDFASTKHKGLPEKKKPEGKSEAPKKKKEKTEEAGGTGTPTASSGFGFGKGIYDSLDRDVEAMIAESMNISMNANSDGANGPSKSLTVTATDDDALKLSELLKNAGLGGGDAEGYGGEGYKSSCGCGTPDCSCGDEEVDEAYGDNVVSQNKPNWPTNQEGAEDNFEYSGGLNKPKSTGQTTTPVIASQEERQESYAEAEEDAIKRMMEMAGIKEGKKPDFLDIDKDGDEKESFKKAVDDKKEKKVDEGILSATANLWTEYKGKYGV